MLKYLTFLKKKKFFLIIKNVENFDVFFEKNFTNIKNKIYILQIQITKKSKAQYYK